MLRQGDHGPAVLEVQQELLALSYSLPRWGADGALGGETLAALDAYEHDHGLARLSLSGIVPDLTLTSLSATYALRATAKTPAGFLDCTQAHDGRNRIRKRAWSEVTGITLHQTACVLGERPERWYQISVQMGVTRGGRILLLNPIEYLTWHGHALN